MWPWRLWRWRFELQQAADKHGLDPSLLAAIMERESQGGEALTPPTRLGTGDGGHGRGLMQIDDRAHPIFCSDIEEWGDALKNVEMAADIFAWGLKVCGGFIEGGIAIYNSGWARERKHPDGTVEVIPWIRELYKNGHVPTVEELDRYTTGHDYVKYVLEKYELYKKIRFS